MPVRLPFAAVVLPPNLRRADTLKPSHTLPGALTGSTAAFQSLPDWPPARTPTTGPSAGPSAPTESSDAAETGPALTQDDSGQYEQFEIRSE